MPRRRVQTKESAGPRGTAVFVGRAAELERLLAASDKVKVAVIYGVPGVGKSAFLREASEALCRRHGARLLHHTCRSGESLATIIEALRTALRVRPGPGSRRPGAIAELVAAAEARPLVLSFDDVQRVKDPEAFHTLVDLVLRRAPLWLCLASREDLALAPTALDHLVVRLRGLSRGEVEHLWAELERLYGPATSTLESGWQASRGNPLLIKQAFAGPLVPALGDPFGLAELAPRERQILTQVCVSRRPLLVSSLARHHPAEELDASLRRLARRFLLEVHPDGRLGAHDLVKELIGRDTSPLVVEAHRRCLEAHRSQVAAPTDASLEIEALHHAVACGDDAFADRVLERHASSSGRMLPLSAIAEQGLADAIDALARRRDLPPRVRLLRARIRGRQGEVRRAFAEASALPVEDEPLVHLDLGEMAYMLGQYPEAERQATLAASDERLALEARVWATITRIESIRSQGDLARAERATQGATPLFAEAGPAGQALQAWLTLMQQYDREDLESASKAVARVRAHLAKAGPGVLRVPLLDSLERVVAVARGQDPIAAVETGEYFDDILFFRLAARHFRVDELVMRGQLREALDLATASTEAASRSGFVGLVAWGTQLASETERLRGDLGQAIQRLSSFLVPPEEAGRTREAARIRALLAHAWLYRGELQEARALAAFETREPGLSPGARLRLLAASALVRATAGEARAALEGFPSPGPVQGFNRWEFLTARAELLLWAGQVAEGREQAHEVAHQAERAGWGHLVCRARLLEAEALFRLGDLEAASGLLASVQAVAREQGYAAEEIEAGLLAGAVQRSRGDLEAARAHLAAAEARATRGGYAALRAAAEAALAVTQGLAPTVTQIGQWRARRLHLDEPAGLELVTASSGLLLTTSHLAEVDLSPFSVSIDLVRGRIRAGRRTADLSRRRTLIRILATLAHSLGESVPVDELVRQVWGVAFHPIRHQSRLSVSIARLRELVRPATIETRPDGFVLRLPERWALLRRNKLISEE